MINVLYEDNHIIVVEKPINVLSQSDNTKDMDMLTLVKQYVKEKYNKPGNVYIGLLHRLDRPVGGIMVFARTSKAAARLSRDISNHSFRKRYLAVVDHIIGKDSDVLTDYLIKNSDGNSIITDESTGKKAELIYKVIKRNQIKDKTLIEVDLKTGRHHQIRVQLANYGHPICGDQRYNKMDKTQISLYAYYLEFTHPVTKELLQFSLLPKEKGHWTEFTSSRCVNEK